MKAIQALDYQVVFNQDGIETLNQLLSASSYSKIFIIVDSNTQEQCLAPFMSKLATEISIEVIEIEPGEENKTIATCEGVWDALAHLDADRKGIIINLGGGVVTDLGGFVASTFKRGMDFINVPTTLLSMVDASVGGKTGVDLGVLKNLIGVINNPQLVLIDTSYLSTLSSQEMRSGLAEIYKHGYFRSCYRVLLLRSRRQNKTFTRRGYCHRNDFRKLCFCTKRIAKPRIIRPYCYCTYRYV